MSVRVDLDVPVVLAYDAPSDKLVGDLKLDDKPCSVRTLDRVKELHTYRGQGYAGTLEDMVLRSAVARQLAAAVDLLPQGCELWIYDAFRTRQTQLSLFEHFYKLNEERYPHLNKAELYAMTREFVAHPEEVSRFAIPPHNSGGAVDLVVAVGGQELDMGTNFDDDSPQSATSFFEQPYTAALGISFARWLMIRTNRRLLFNAMKGAGFVNYAPEWWHYDLGDCIWASTLNIDWYYDSLEDKIQPFTKPRTAL